MVTRRATIIAVLIGFFAFSHVGHNFYHHSEKGSLSHGHSHSFGCFLGSLFLPWDFDHGTERGGVPGKNDCPTCKILTGTRYSTVTIPVGITAPVYQPENIVHFFEASHRAVIDVFSDSVVPRAPPA